ncbi:hypothetical protein L3V79_05990 [Thiotrichales bacterium 19S9-12]|nr:hypothetical protein [Thiotrichales bacterium 19S9-11]MCF6811909.1 hypothetical protein [Thiotrichales bacterium 19S9-12]
MPGDDWKALGLPDPKLENMSTDIIFNVASFDFLKNIINHINDDLLESEVFNDIKAPLQEVKKYCNTDMNYDASYPYGNLRKALISKLRSFINKIEEKGLSLSKEQQKFFDCLVISCIENENKALEFIYEVISDDLNRLHQTSNEAKDKITTKLQPKGSLINTDNPSNKGSLVGLTKAFGAWTTIGGYYLGLSYQPFEWNIPQVVQYKYKELKAYPKEDRMGTIGVYKEAVEEIEPFAKYYLQAVARRAEEKKDLKSKFSTIYFNFLQTKGKTSESLLEGGITDKLHKLEESDQYGVAVITMPLKFTTYSTISLEDYKKKLADAFTNNLLGVKFSSQVRSMLFQKEGQFEQKINDLLDQSASKLKFDDHVELNKNNQIALYQYFSKYLVVKFLIEELGPDILLFICKDGIDRSRVASLIYNLMESIETGSPMTKNEFLQALHAAAVLVKGRPMNENIKNFWIFIDALLNANQALIESHSTEYLAHWRDENTLPEVLAESQEKERLLDKLKSEADEIKNEPRKLIQLYNEVTTIDDSAKNRYRGLAFERGYLPSRYFGRTYHLYLGVEHIKNLILKHYDENSMPLDLIKKSEEIFKRHEHPWRDWDYSFRDTNQVKKLKSKSSSTPSLPMFVNDNGETDEKLHYSSSATLINE